jgi:hypothetical protein
MLSVDSTFYYMCSCVSVLDNLIVVWSIFFTHTHTHTQFLYMVCASVFTLLETSNKRISRQIASHGYGRPIFASQIPPLGLGNANDFAHDVHQRYDAGTPSDVTGLLHTSYTWVALLWDEWRQSGAWHMSMVLIISLLSSSIESRALLSCCFMECAKPFISLIQ